MKEKKNNQENEYDIWYKKIQNQMEIDENEKKSKQSKNKKKNRIIIEFFSPLFFYQNNTIFTF